MTDHDELFKALLTVFFLEFVAAFLPDVLPYLDPASIEFVDKELLKGVRGRGKRYADLLVKARFKGQETFFLIHIENQSKAEPGFAKRMFRYFARLIEKFDLPVYPVALLSFDAPNRAEPDRFEVVFPNKTVLQFAYTAIQLNRLSWKDYLKTPNPAAAALMTKMQIAPEDRVRVASEITRMRLTLKLDADKAELIFGFMETYLQLTGEELMQYERELDELLPEERETQMQGWTKIGRENYARGKQDGVQEGKQEGKEELVVSLMNRRFGAVSAQITERVDELPDEKLTELGVALFDFTSLTDVENWLAQQSRN